MALIVLETLIEAPPEVVFDLSLDVDAHQASAVGTSERVVGGVRSGCMKLGDVVTWEARHLGFTWRMTVEICAYDRPRAFADRMVRGPFARMHHTHEFAALGAGTRMIDRFDVAAPLGPLGRLAERLFLVAHLERFLRVRNAHLKAAAEARARGR